METRVALLAEDEDLRERERFGVRDGEQRSLRAHRGEAARGAAVQLQLRRSTAADDLAIAPEDAARMARAERLHRRLFGREPSGEVDGRHSTAGAVRDFAVGEDPAQETVAESFDGVGNPADVGRVEAEAENVRHGE